MTIDEKLYAKVIKAYNETTLGFFPRGEWNTSSASAEIPDQGTGQLPCSPQPGVKRLHRALSPTRQH